MKTKFLLFTLFFSFNNLHAQPTIQWQKSLGGTNGDYAYAIQQTTDKGYIVAGESFSNDSDVSGHHGSVSSNDAWIVKLDSIGVIQWEEYLGSSGGDDAYSIQQTTDGGYILAGESTLNN